MIQSQVLAWIRCYNLVPTNSLVVAACSGGPDSLALVDLLQALQTELDFTLQVAHLDHGLRGEAALADAAFVREFSAKRGLPFHCAHIDVAAETARCGGSIEETGRRLRYEYLREVARQNGAAVIATGHHRDDQAETVLLNFLRGSGPLGMSGMRPRQGDLIRPLLCLTRAQIENWCRQRGLSPRTDSSNHDVEFRRNSIRHELLPLLRERYNPSLVETLCRSAEVFAADHHFIQSNAENVFQKIVRVRPNGLAMDAEPFAALPTALQRELIRCMVENLQGHIRGLEFLQIERVRELFLHAAGTRSLDLSGGLRAERSYRKLFLGYNECKTWRPEKNGKERIVLNYPGETWVAALGWRVQCRLVDDFPPEFSTLPVTQALFDPAALHPPLWIRTRQPGDRIHLLGSSGAKKLKELLIDQKIPAAKRDEIPLIGDEKGILWAVGLRRANRAKISRVTKPYLMIEVSDFAETENNRHRHL